jgi:hypothetical protein
MQTLRGFLIVIKLSFEVRPDMLDEIEVWKVGWPYHDRNIMVLEPFLSEFAGVFGVVVLLENNI